MPQPSIKGRKLKIDKARPKGEYQKREGGFEKKQFQRMGPRFNL